MVQLQPIILLGKPKKKKSKILSILTSPKTTLALLGILGAAAFPAAAGRAALTLIPKTPTGIAKAAFVGGALTAVPSLAKTFNPFKAGQKAAPFIADPSKLLPAPKQPLGEKIKEVAKVAGLGAGAVAAVAGAAAVVKKVVSKAKLPEIAKLPAALPAAIIQPTLAEPTAPAALQPLGAVQPTPKPKEPKAEMPSISNIINFKPQIDIRFSKSHKFINQQLLIR